MKNFIRNNKVILSVLTTLLILSFDDRYIEFHRGLKAEGYFYWTGDTASTRAYARSVALTVNEDQIGSQIQASLDTIKGLQFVEGTDISIVTATGLDEDTMTISSTSKYRTGAKSGDTINIAGTTFTPTLADATNLTSTGVSGWKYSRSGNTVTASGGVTYTVTTGATLSSFTLTIPVGIELAGPISVSGGGTDNADYVGWYVAGTGSSATKIIFQTKPTSTGAHGASIIYQYTVK